VADILLGIAGACLGRFIMEQVVVPLEFVYLLLFSIWGAGRAASTGLDYC
jgi:uncharacterized membrane protein YeaQ/YmgE (transglycosylase-associated protein family)